MVTQKDKISEDRGILHTMKEDLELVPPYRIPPCQNVGQVKSHSIISWDQLEQQHQQKCVSTQQKLNCVLHHKTLTWVGEGWGQGYFEGSFTYNLGALTSGLGSINQV